MGGLVIPHIITTTDGKEHNSDLLSYDFSKHRIIYLNGEIKEDTALAITTQLRYLDGKSTKDIYLFINSPGGTVSDGMVIYDYMKHNVQSDVVTIATGMTASMGSFLLAAGTPGKRYATPSAEIMIHQPLGGVQGQATDISLVAEHIQKIKIRLSTILADECEQKIDDIMKDMERDFWMTSEEALNYGLVDIVGYPEIV